MSYTEIATARATAETYAGKMSRIADELLAVLRDVLGPERRLPKPRAAYARYGDHEVTVRDGEDGRVEVTAHLTADGAVREYSARLTRGDREPRPGTAVGPLRIDCSEAPEERPTLTYVLPLVTALEAAEGRLQRAERALREAGYWHEVKALGSRIVLLESRSWGSQAVASVGLDPYNGSLRTYGRDAFEARGVLHQVKIF